MIERTKNGLSFDLVKITSIFLFSLLTVTSSSGVLEQYPHKSGVIQLNKELFKEITKTFDFVFVEFSVPWCVHCNKVEKMLPKTAELVQESVHKLLPVAKFDCDKRYEYCHEALGIMGYPTLRLYYRGQFVDYKGERTPQAMTEWLDDRFNHALEDYPSQKEIEELLADEEDVFIVYCISPKSPLIQTAKTFATISPTAHFFLTFDPDVARQHHLSGEEEDIVFLKLHDEGKAFYSEDYPASKGPVTVERLVLFYAKHENPLVSLFGEGLAEKLETDKKAAIVLFCKDSDHEVAKIFGEAAEKYRGHSEILFARTNLALHDATDEFLIRSTGLLETDFPAVRLLDFRSGRKLITQYSFPGGLLKSADIIRGAELFEEEALKEHKKNQKLDPNEDGQGFVRLNRASAKKILKAPKKPVFVVLTAPERLCPSCNSFPSSLSPSLQESVDSSSPVYLLDTVLNSIDGWVFPSPPALLCLWGGHAQQMGDTSPGRGKEGMREFIERCQRMGEGEWDKDL